MKWGLGSASACRSGGGCRGVPGRQGRPDTGGVTCWDGSPGRRCVQLPEANRARWPGHSLPLHGRHLSRSRTSQRGGQGRALRVRLRRVHAQVLALGAGRRPLRLLRREHPQCGGSRETGPSTASAVGRTWVGLDDRAAERGSIAGSASYEDAPYEVTVKGVEEAGARRGHAAGHRRSSPTRSGFPERHQLAAATASDRIGWAPGVVCRWHREHRGGRRFEGERDEGEGRRPPAGGEQRGGEASAPRGRSSTCAVTTVRRRTSCAGRTGTRRSRFPGPDAHVKASDPGS